MTTRDEYVTTLKNQLDRWNAEAARWEEQARAARADFKKACDKQLKTLAERREEARYNLKLLEGASANAWTELQRGADLAWKNMREATDKARAHFSKAG